MILCYSGGKDKDLIFFEVFFVLVFVFLSFRIKKKDVRQVENISKTVFVVLLLLLRNNVVISLLFTAV